MDDIGARLTRLILDAHAILRDIETAKSLGTDSGNMAERLAAELPADGSPLPITPYAEIVPNLRIGFEAGTGVKAEARQLPAAAGARQARIAITELGTTRWLTIECICSWADIIAKNSAHVLVEAAVSPPLTIRPKLRMRMRDGKDYDIEARPFSLGQKPQIQISSLILPENAMSFDLNERPTIILFLDLSPAVLTISRLFVW
jgi:hypothetical protein